jgi:hypothetical protein
MYALVVDPNIGKVSEINPIGIVMIYGRKMNANNTCLTCGFKLYGSFLNRVIRVRTATVRPPRLNEFIIIAKRTFQL